MIIGTPFAKGAGYFCNDNTASGGQREQADVRTCPHCQAVILMQMWRRIEDGKMSGGFCTQCNAPVCGLCNKRMQTHGCEPFMERIERGLSQAEKLRVFRKLAGLDQPEPPRALIVPGN